MSSGDASPPIGFSKAFQNFVQQPDSLVGLLAYALYKQSINERVRNGLPVAEPQHRDPQSRELQIYSSQAESLLRAFAQTAIDDERASILTQGLDDRFAVAVRELKAAVRAGTGFWWPGVVIGVVAWLISIVLTLLIAFSAPAWVKSLVAQISPG